MHSLFPAGHPAETATTVVRMTTSASERGASVLPGVVILTTVVAVSVGCRSGNRLCMPDDLVTTEGVDEQPEPPAEPDPAGPAGILPDEPPASPVPPVPGDGKGPGQELSEGED